MKIFTCPVNQQLASWEKPQKLTNKPFWRHSLIVPQLEKDEKMPITFFSKFDAEKNYALLLELGHDKDFLLFLEKSWQSWEEDRSLFPQYASEYGGFVVGTYARERSLKYRELPLWRQFGYWINEDLTPVYKHSYDSAMLCVGLVCESVNYFLEKMQEKIHYCLTPFPGHHATFNSFSGYCFLNNAAIAGKLFLKNNKRIAFLDIDFHHGDGTQKIFWENEEVLTMSIHADPSYEYPCWSGFTSENTNSNLNFPLTRKLHEVDIQYYKENALLPALEKLKSWKADILIIPFGADTWKDDKDAIPNCRFSLDIPDYRTIGNLISSSFEGKIFVTQEGGYDMENVPSIVHSFLKGLAE